MAQSFLDQLQIVAKDWPGRTEADLQADIHQLLRIGNFLIDNFPKLEAQSGDGTSRRIDIEYGSLVIECKREVNPSKRSAFAKDEGQLAGYLVVRQEQTDSLWAGILTNGRHWRHYRLDSQSTLRLVSEITIDSEFSDERSFRVWLGSALPTQRRVRPTTDEIEGRLGSESPSHNITTDRLRELLKQGGEKPEIELKRSLWVKLLRTAFGTQFDGSEELFVEHTYLVILATLIARAVVGLTLDATPATLLSGESFSTLGIVGVGEAGFFDWPLDIAGGDEIVMDISKRVSSFDWSTTDHDVLKALYQSVISPDVRHKLGEYYTPDWLATLIVSHVVVDPLSQRVLDPACGSGTFLFAAIDRYFEAAESEGIEISEAVDRLPNFVVGIDIHPVATTLAQVTYLLAIGTERLSQRSKTFSVPVYLGDSIRWDDPTQSGGDLFHSNDDIVIKTGEDLQLFDMELRFPSEVTARSDFDSLINELSEKAAGRDRRAPRPSIIGILNKYTSVPASRTTLTATYSVLCDLHESGRDHIWGYYVRNQAKPSWFSRAENNVDVLIGNPPWLSYRYMPTVMQQKFKSRSKERNLWSGGKVATHQDLSALFVARSCELYLKPGGHFGFVMPLAVLSRQSYEGFRTGRWTSEFGPALVSDFEEPWSLLGVKPSPFPVPASVIFGSKSELVAQSNVAMPKTVQELSGHVQQKGGVISGIELSFSSETLTMMSSDTVYLSPYGSRFRQGATLVPRFLVLADHGPEAPLARASQISIHSRRSSQEKQPWKSIASVSGVVESEFIRKVVLGESIIPFRMDSTLDAVLPWHQKFGFLSTANPQVDRFPGLAHWLNNVEQIWGANKSPSSKLSFIDQIDFMHKLETQFPIAPIRVVYSKSGNSLVAAILTDTNIVVDHKLYWAAVPTMNEARYLTAILNASHFTDLIRPYQSIGAFGPRDFDMYVWMPPTPLFEPSSPLHQELANLAAVAEAVVERIDFPSGSSFQSRRKTCRQALSLEGVDHKLNALVLQLLE